MSAGDRTEPRSLVDDAREACTSWSSNHCFIDDRGGYRSKDDGKVASWSKSAQVVFRGSDELHSVARKSPRERDNWIEARLSGTDTLRIDKYGLREAHRTLQLHARLIKLAIEALGSGIEGDDPEGAVTKALALIENGWRPSEPWAEVFG